MECTLSNFTDDTELAVFDVVVLQQFDRLVDREEPHEVQRRAMQSPAPGEEQPRVPAQTGQRLPGGDAALQRNIPVSWHGS